MSDTTSPTFLNGSLHTVLGSAPNNNNSNTDATDDNIIHGSDISSNDYSGRFIAVNDDYLFVSKHPQTGTNNNADDLVSRSYITVFKFNEDGTQTQVTTIPQPTQYVFSSSHDANKTWVASMSLDNDYLVVGCPNHKMLNVNGNPMSKSGAIAIFQKDEGGTDNWGLKQFIGNPLANNSGNFGVAVAISDGYIAVTEGVRMSYNTTVTRHTVTDYEGSVFVYKKDNADNWNFLDRIRHPPVEWDTTSSSWKDYFGFALEMDGEWLAISDPERRQDYKYNQSWSSSPSSGNKIMGSVFLYKRDTTQSTHFKLKTTIFQKYDDQRIATFESDTSINPSSTAYPYSSVMGRFGHSISLYKNTIMVGAKDWYWQNYSSNGAIYIYDFNNDTGKAQLVYMFAGTNSAYAGLWLNINKNRAVCSRYNFSIYSFKKINNVWKYQNRITKNYQFFTSTDWKFGGGYYIEAGRWNRNLQLNDKSIFYGVATGDKTYSNTGGVYRFPFTTDKNHLMLTFNENLRYDVNIDKTDFALQENYINKPILDTKIESGLVKIEPEKDMDDIKKLKITYTKNATSGTPLIIGDTFTTFIADADFNNSDVYDMVQLGTDYYICGYSDYKIYKITYDGVCTELGGSVVRPWSITTDGKDLYVSGDDKIVKVKLDGTSSTFVGYTYSGSRDNTTSPEFYHPRGITSDNAGEYLYVGDKTNHKIRKVAISNGYTTTIAGSGNNSNNDGSGTSATFSNPSKPVITNDDRYLYVGSSGQIRKIDLTNNVVTTVSHSFTLGSETKMCSIDPNNEYLYMADYNNAKIYRLKLSDDTVSLFAGGGTVVGTIGALLDTHFYGSVLSSVLIDSNYNILTGNSSGTNKIRKIASSGGSKNIMDIAGNAVDSFTHNFDDIKPTHTTTEIVSGSGSGSWTEDTSIASTYDWYGITSSADGTKVAAVVDRGNIWTSSNSGVTWTENTSTGATKRWTDITSSSDGTKLAAIVVGGNIWISTDSGATWTENTTSPVNKSWTKITSSDDFTKLAATVQNGNIWTSTNSGATWTEDTSVGETKNWWIITSSPDGTKLTAGVYGGNIWTSTDSGANWTETTVGDGTNNWYGITMSSDGTKMAAVSWGQVDNSGKIWISTDSGATWTMDTTVGSAKNWTKITSSSDGTKLAATAYGGNIWTSTDSGATWTETTVGDGTNNWRGITMSSDGTNLAATVKAGKIWTMGPPPSKFALSFSETIKDNANIDKNDFSVLFEGVAQTISSVEISDGKVNITPAVAELCDVEITYTKNATSSKNIIDRADNAVDTFTYKSTKRSTFKDYSLKHHKKYNDNTTIHLGFTGEILENNNIDKNDFSVTVNGSVLTLNDAVGNKVEIFAGDGGTNHHYGHGSDAGIPYPTKIVVVDDFVYVRNVTNFYKISKKGYVSNMTGTFTSSSATYDGGFVYLNGWFYWVERQNNKIKKMSLSESNKQSPAMQDFVGNGYGILDGDSSTAKFRNVFDITTDGTNLYVTDLTAIRKVTLNGDVTTLAGSTNDATAENGDVDGIGTSVRFGANTYKTLTYHNNCLYIADRGNNKVKKLNLSNNEVTTIITITNYQIYDIEIINSKIYILRADSKIYRYDIDGSNEEHFAGATVDGNGGNVNGDLLTAKFSHPQRMSYADGDIYISDQANKEIKIIRGSVNGNSITKAEIKNGTISLIMREKINVEKNKVSVSYTKNTDVTKRLSGTNNFAIKSFTTPIDTIKPIVKNIFAHYSTINVGTAISGQLYREADKEITFTHNIAYTQLACAGNYVMIDSDASTKKIYIYYYDGTNWNEQKVITYDNSSRGGSFYLTEEYAFVGFQTTYGEIRVYKREGTIWNDFQTITGIDLHYTVRNYYSFGQGLLAYKNYLVTTFVQQSADMGPANAVHILKMNKDNTAYEKNSIVGHSYPRTFYAIGGPQPRETNSNKTSMTMNDNYLCVGMQTNQGSDGGAYSRVHMREGHCFIYKKLFNDSGGWTYHKRLDAISPGHDSQFGMDMDINDRFLIVSQKKYGAGLGHDGVIYVYDINNDFKLIQTINKGKTYFGTNLSLSKDNIIITGARMSNSDKACYFYRYNGSEFVEVYDIKALGYTSNDDSTNHFGFTSAILNDVVVVSDNSKKKIYSAQLVKNDKKIIEVCFTKPLTDNANIDKDDFTIKSDGISNPIVSVTIINGKLLFTVTNNIVNENSIEFAYTKNTNVSKNIKSDTLDVDSYGIDSLTTPSSFTLEDKGNIIAGENIKNNNYVKVTTENYDIPTSFNASTRNASYSKYQLYAAEDDILFTYTHHTNQYSDSGWSDYDIQPSGNYSYQTYIVMHKKINGVWTNLHAFTAWNQGNQNNYHEFGKNMVYHNGYLLTSATNMDTSYRGRVYLLKYNSITNLMERVGYISAHDEDLFSSNTQQYWGDNISLDDKYIYVYGRQGESSQDIWVYNYDMKLVYHIEDVIDIPQDKNLLGRIEQLHMYGSTSKIKAFKVGDSHYFMTVRRANDEDWNYNSTTNIVGTGTYVILVFKKKGGENIWNIHQIFFPNNLSTGLNYSALPFGLSHAMQIHALEIDTETNTIFIGSYSDASLYDINHSRSSSSTYGIGGVYIFNYDETSGMWGDTDIYDNETIKFSSMGDIVSYPNDLIIDEDLKDRYGNTSTSNTIQFGGTLKYDSHNKRLLVGSICGFFQNTEDIDSSSWTKNYGTVSVYKYFNNKYNKINSIMSMNMDTRILVAPIGYRKNGDIIVGMNEDIQVAFASINKSFVVSFTKNITLGSNFDKNTLTLKINGEDITLNSIYIENNNKLVILTNVAITDIQTFYMIYTPTNDSRKNILHDLRSIQTFTYGNITKATFSNMELVNNKLEITFTKSIKVTTNFLFENYEVFISGIKKKIKTIEIVNGKLVIEINETIADINTVKFNYIKNSLADNYQIRCINGVSIESFEHIHNNTPTTFTTQSIVSGNVELQFSDNIADNTNIDKNDFNLFISGVINGLSSVSVSNGKVLVSSTNIPSSNINDICIIYRKNSDEKKQLKNTYGLPVQNFLTNTETATPELDLYTHYYSNSFAKNAFGEDDPGENWNTISSIISGATGHNNNSALFGGSVKRHGNYLFVSDRGYSSSRGRVFIYKYQEPSWVFLKNIYAPDQTNGDVYASSLDYYNNYLVVGAESEDTGGTQAGSVYIYKKDEGGADNWGHIKTLRNPGNPVTGLFDNYSHFGRRVAIYDNYLCVSAPRMIEKRNSQSGSYGGAVFLFKKDEGGSDNWGLVNTYQDSKNISSSVYYGYDISISDDVLVISNLRNYGDNRNAVDVFIRNGDNWEYSEKIWDSDMDYGGSGGTLKFGYKVKTDGNYILSYAQNGNVTGASTTSGIVFLYSRDSNNKFILTKVFGIENSNNIYFGDSLDIKDDVIAIGAYGDDVTGSHKGGSVYIYSKDEGGLNNWGLTSIIRRGYTYSEGEQDYFAKNKALSIDYENSGLVIGADREDTTGSNRGSIYLVDQGKYINEKNKIVLNTRSFIKDTTLDKNDFTVESYTGLKTIFSVEVVDGRVVLTLTSDIENINRVVITYTKNADTMKNIKNSADIAMNSFSIGDISDVFMTTLFKNTGDTSIDVSFTKDISANSNVSKRDFTLKIDDVEHNIETVSIASGKVKIQINMSSIQAISSIDDVYVKYTKSIFPEQHITDYNGNEVITCDSAPPTVVDITHPFNLVENIGRPVTGENYRYESRSFTYNDKNITTEYNADNNGNRYLGYGYKIHNEWLIAHTHYKYEGYQREPGAIVVFKYDSNELTYKFFQFIPYGAIFGPADMYARNSNFESSTYKSNYRYFGYYNNLALNDRYMVIRENTLNRWFLYEYNGSSWININEGSTPEWNNGFHINKYNYLIVGSNHGSQNPSFIKIYKIIGVNLVHIKDIGSPDTELTSAKHFAGANLHMDGTTIVTSNHEYPEKDYNNGNTGSGTVYIYDQNTKVGNTEWGLVKKISAPQNWIDIPLPTSGSNYGSYFGYAFAIGDDVLTVMAGNNNNQQSSKERIFIYHKDEGGINNWGLVKEFTPTFIDMNANNHLYFGVSHSHWNVSCNKNYMTLQLTADTTQFSKHGIQLYSRNEGGQNNWGLLKEIFPEHTYNPETTEDGDSYFGKMGTNNNDSAVKFGINDQLIIPQYRYKGKLIGSSGYLWTGRILLLDTKSKVYETNKITINTTEIIKNINTYDKNDFTVYDHLGQKTPTNIDISNNKIILTLDSAINDINRVLVTYTKDTSNIDNNIKDLNNNKMDSFTHGDITNPNYVSKQLGNTELAFGTTISDKLYVEDLRTENNDQIRALDKNNVSSASETRLLFSRGNFIFLYYTSGRGQMEVYEYKNGYWQNYGGYKNPSNVTKLYSAQRRGMTLSKSYSSYYHNFWGAAHYQVHEQDDYRMKYNMSRLLSTNGLLWYPGQRNNYGTRYVINTGVVVPLNKFDNQMYFPSTIDQYGNYHTALAFGDARGNNAYLKGACFGDDWAFQYSKTSHNSYSGDKMHFSRFNKDIQRFDYHREITSDTFFSGAGFHASNFHAHNFKYIRGNINNNYFVLTFMCSPNDTNTSDYYVWKRDASNNWVYLLKNIGISNYEFGYNTQGILYNHFYMNSGESNGNSYTSMTNPIVHDLSNNVISELNVPGWATSYSYQSLDVCDDFAVVGNRTDYNTPNGTRGVVYIFLRRSDNHFGLGTGPKYNPNMVVYNDNTNNTETWCTNVQIHKETNDILTLADGQRQPVRIIKYQLLYNVILQINEPIQLRGTEDKTNFFLEYQSNEIIIESLGVDNNNNILLRTQTQITNVNNVGVIYDKDNNDITKNIRDIAGNPLNEFGQINTNPIMVSFVLDSNNNNIIDITHNRKILNATYDINDYKVKEGSTTIAVNSIGVDNKIIKLTLSQNITNIDIVEITYTRNQNSSENVKDLFNNVLKTQVIGNTNIPVFNSILTQPAGISYGSSSPNRDHNLVTNILSPPDHSMAVNFGWRQAITGDYLVSFSHSYKRPSTTDTGAILVYKWNGNDYEYKSITYPSVRLNSNGNYSDMKVNNDYLVLSHNYSDVCMIFKMNANDTYVEETAIQPSGFSGSLITDINSPHTVHYPATALPFSGANNQIFTANQSWTQQRSVKNSSNYYGYYFRTIDIHTGNHVYATNNRKRVGNPGGVTIKFKIHAGETYALKLQYTTSSTTSTNYNYWTHTDVGYDWNEVFLPHGYMFVFSGDTDYRVRAAELEVYVLPFVGFSPSEADKFGNTGAISNDWLAVGDHYATSSYNSNGGLVFLFKKENGSWVEKQKIEAPSTIPSNVLNKWNLTSQSNNTQYFGAYVNMVNNLLLVSHYNSQSNENGRGNYNNGSIQVYKLNTTSDIWEWNTMIVSNNFQCIKNDSATSEPEPYAKSNSGLKIKMFNATSASYTPMFFNGTYLAVRLVCGYNNYVDIFKFSNDDFTFKQRIIPPHHSSNASNFGNDIFIDNNYLVVYEYQSYTSGVGYWSRTTASILHIFKNNNDVWTYEETFMSDQDNPTHSNFGRGSLVHGNRIIAGNPNLRKIYWNTIEPTNYVDLNFNQTIPANITLSTSDFSMIYNAVDNPINSVIVYGGKVRLETTISVTDLSNVKLTYTKNANAVQNIQNSNGVSVDSFVYKGNTTKPTFDSLTVSTNQTINSGLYTTTITLTFTDTLLQNNNIDKNDFSAEYSGSSTTVHTAVISSGKVELTIKTDNNAVADSDFFLTYTKNTNTTKNIGDGMDNYVDTFNYIPGFAFRDTTISNGKISLNWTTPLNDTVSIDKDDFTVTIDGEPEIITAAEISTKSVLLTSTNTITDASLVRATYTKNTTVSKNLKSLADNEIVETFSTSPEPATLSSTTIGGNTNPNKIYLNWGSVSTTNKSRFSKHNFILRNHRGRRIRFNSIETAGSGQITLTSSQNLIGGNRYFLSYKRDFMRNNRIRDANNRIVDSFWNRPIYTNNITQPNITIESATVNNATPTKILIDLNTEVNVDNKVGMPFTVSCRGSNNLLKSTIVASYNIINTNNENHIELTTNRTFINGDKILLHYTRPVLSANQIKGSNSGLPNSSRTYNYTVTASNGAFNISGEARKLLYLNRGDTYVFSLSNASLSGHPFKLSLTNNGSHNSGVEYTQGVTITGTPGQNGANLTFVVPVDAPGNLYYYCSNHSDMGSRIFCSGTVINSMPTIRNYDVKNKVGPALFSDFKKLDANIGTNYGFTENVHSINTGEELGKSVEIDGDYSIIGGPGNNRVLINYFSNNAWAQQKELTGQNSSDKFGISVAISGDTAVVGASNYNSNKGKIYIYKRSGTSWNSQQTIEGEGSDDYFGHSVSIDGDTIVTSANEKGSNDFGKIYIYKRSGTTWSLEHNITGSVNNDKIGEKVVVKGDVMAYSTSSHSEHRGNVVIYNRSGSTWSKTEDIVGTKANEKIGKSLSLDTNTLLVGNPDANTVFMYEYANSEWTRTEEFENTDSTNFGSSVDIDIANNKLVIGADSDTVNGKIYVYEKENSVWNVTQDFIGESSGDNYGKDVSISNNRILSSAPNKAKTGGGVSAGKFYYHKLLTTERLEITFDDNLKSRPGIDKDDFVLESDGNANTIEKVYISNGKLIINHQTLITDTNTIVLTYTKNVDATKNLLDLDGNAIITFTYPDGPSVEEAGIGTIQLRTKVTTVVPTSITKTNGIFDFRNITQDKGVKSVVDDTPVKKRLRTRTFIRDIFKELKKKDTTFDSKSGSTKINKNLLAFTEKVSKRVHETVRLYDADSTIDMRSITKGESIYIPLETNESVVISLPNTTIGGGTTDYTFTKNANDTTTISPALDGKDTVNDDDVIIHGDYNVAIGSIVVGDNPLHLHIPFIFDVSGNVVVYGEKVVDTQYYTARHEFTAGDPTSSLTADKLKDLYFYSDETENYAVTVLAGKFALNGESEKVLRLQKGVRYIFDLSDATNNTHPFKLSTTKNGTHNGGSEYVTGVRSYGTPGSPDSAVEFFISTNAPAELFYYCGAHSGSGDYGMGSSIKISDKAAMFYRGSDISSNIVKDALHADLCSNTSNIKHDTTHSKVATKTGDYNPPITSTSGNSLGNILVRYIATHLMSHPLAQAFITNDDSIENDVNGTGQNQSKIAETLITQFNDNLVADGTTPRKNQVIQSLFEQMIAGDINRFMVGDDSGKQPIPFKTGDKLVFYVNMKAKLQIESNVISPATPISLVELFPNSIYPLLDDSNGELDAGLWKIVLTIS